MFSAKSFVFLFVRLPNETTYRLSLLFGLGVVEILKNIIVFLPITNISMDYRFHTTNVLWNINATERIRNGGKNLLLCTRGFIFLIFYILLALSGEIACLSLTVCSSEAIFLVGTFSCSESVSESELSEEKSYGTSEMKLDMEEKQTCENAVQSS